MTASWAYSAKSAASTVGVPTGWPPTWDFPPESGPAGPWPPGLPAPITSPTFIAAAGSDVVYSTDSGATWTKVTGFSGPTQMTGSGNIIYGLSDGSGTFTAQLSLDVGATWNTRKAIDPGGTGDSTTGYTVIDTTRVIVGHQDSNNAGIGVSYSDDGCATWTEVAGIAATAAGTGSVLELANGDVLLFDPVLGDTKTYVYKSTDAGLTWASLSNFACPGNARSVLCDNGNIVVTAYKFTAGLQGVAYMSADSGATWTQTLTEQGAYTGYGSIAALDDEVIVVLADGTSAIRMFYSDDGGATWNTGDVISHNLGTTASAGRCITSYSAGWMLIGQSNGGVANLSVYTSTATTGFAAVAGATGTTQLVGSCIVIEE